MLVGSWRARSLKLNTAAIYAQAPLVQMKREPCGLQQPPCVRRSARKPAAVLSNLSPLNRGLSNGTQAPTGPRLAVSQTRKHARKGKSGVRKCLPDVEVLDIDIFIWGRLSLAPEEESFLGRGFCNDRKVSSKAQLRAQPSWTGAAASGLRTSTADTITSAALTASSATVPLPIHLPTQSPAPEALPRGLPQEMARAGSEPAPHARLGCS